MAKELMIQARNSNISKAIDFIQSALKESDVEQSKAYRSTLVIEELLTLMIQHAPGEEASVRIRVYNRKKYAGIRNYHDRTRQQVFPRQHGECRA